MKLKFLKTTAFGQSGVYYAGQTYDVADKPAAEIYIRHGYAVEVTQPAPAAPATQTKQPPE